MISLVSASFQRRGKKCYWLLSGKRGNTLCIILDANTLIVFVCFFFQWFLNALVHFSKEQFEYLCILKTNLGRQASVVLPFPTQSISLYDTWSRIYPSFFKIQQPENKGKQIQRFLDTIQGFSNASSLLTVPLESYKIKSSTHGS